MGEQVAKRRARWPGRLVEVDDALLGGDEARVAPSAASSPTPSGTSRSRSPCASTVDRTRPSDGDAASGRPVRRPDAARPRGDTRRAVERQRVSSGGTYEPIMVGYCRAVRVGRPRLGGGHRARSCPTTPTRPPTPTARRGAASRSSASARRRRRRASSTSSARGSSSRRRRTSPEWRGARRDLPRHPTRQHDRDHPRARRPALAARDRSRCSRRLTRASSRASSTTASARAIRTRWASRRSTCSSTRRSLDLVQHIDTVLAAVEGSDLEDRAPPGADAVGARDLDARVPEHRRRRPPSCGTLRGAVDQVGGRDRSPRRLGRHASVQPLRAAADHRPRPLPRARRPAPVRRTPRADLRHAHPCRDRRAREGDRRRSTGCSSTCRSSSRLSASSPFWRGEPTGPRVDAPARLRRLPALRPAAALPDYADYAEVVGQLERSGCIADYTHIWWDIRPHPRLGTIEVRICDAVTRVEDAVAIAALCQSLVKHYCELLRARARRSRRTTASSRARTSGSRRGTGSRRRVMDLATGRRNRVPVSQLVRRDAPRRRAARARARLRARARGHPRHPRPRAERRRVSCASSTRTATSSRSCEIADATEAAAVAAPA